MARGVFSDVFGVSAVTRSPTQRSLEKSLRELWAKPLRCQDGLDALQKTTELLQGLNSQTQVSEHSSSSISPTAYYAHIVPQHQFINTLALVIYATGIRALGLSEDARRNVRGLGSTTQTAQKTLQALLHALEDVGLGGDRVERAWALAVDKLLHQSVTQFNPAGITASVVDAANDYVVSHVVPWIAMFEKLRKQQGRRASKHVEKPTRTDDATIALLKRITLTRIGRLRAQKLCDDLIAGEVELPQNEQDFLIHHLSTPSARHDITSLFESQLQARVLHSGLSTVTILSIYMRLISHFRILDPSGIVLRRLASPIQAFLRTRPDAVRIVLLSLLEEPREPATRRTRPNTASFCADVARCMADERMPDFREYHEGVDLEDEDWMPEPVDAATGHQGHRNLDAMAHLVTISPREAFMNELQGVLAGRLLQRKGRDANFEREIRLLSVFKQRFEELGIQSCEVMVRDVLASQALNSDIREAVGMGLGDDAGKGTNKEGGMDFDALVLSKYYWPTLQTGAFKVPKAVGEEREKYQSVFRRKKGRRKLEFLESLGRASVVLELEDRTIEIDCTPYQAAVIDAFQHGTRNKTITDLSAALNMDAALVEQALAFWTAQRVLHTTSAPSDPHKTYAVLERLPKTGAGGKPTTQASSMPQPQTLGTPPIKKPEDLLTENKELYSRVVETMLTNQGGMPASRILSMMKMVLPAGFPFEERELQARVLEEMERRGVLMRGEDGVWRVKR